MKKRALYLAAYDISCPRRLRKALRILRGYSSGGQKSVFECFLTVYEKNALIAAMSDAIDPIEDRFIMMRLAGIKQVRVLGKAVKPQDGRFYYVG